MARPKHIRIDHQRLRWYRVRSIDVVTGAPQKLFRHLQDGLRSVGYHQIGAHPPIIRGQAISDTGTTSAGITAERGPWDIKSPWVAVRIGGAVLLAIGLLLILLAVIASFRLSEPLEFLNDPERLLWFATGVIMAVIGAAMAGIHRFRSNLMWINIQGEVYRSALSSGTDLATRSATSNRLSIISELRVAVMACSAITKNSGKGREILKTEDTRDLAYQFDMLMRMISTKILPKIVLQKSVDMRRQEIESEYPPPPPP